MIAEAGHAALWLAAGFALLAAFAPRLAAGPALELPALAISALLTLSALLALIWCFQAADFSIVLVDDNAHRLQPPLARAAAAWSNSPGWLLLMATMLGIAAVIAPNRGMILFVVLTLAALLVLDPFARQALAPPEGRTLSIPTALWQPPVLALAATLALGVLSHGPLPRPPRWVVIGLAVAFVAGIGGAVAEQQLAAETSAPLRSGETMRLGGIEAKLTGIMPTAGPGFTALEATIAVRSGADSTILHPQARTALYSAAETSHPDSASLGLGRIEASLAHGTIRLRWSPLP